MTTREALREGVRGLEERGVPSPRVDAEYLLAHALRVSRTDLYADERELEDAEVGVFHALLRRRAAREPLAYILGEWGFRRLDLAVDARVLIPRPETEVVVERCLERLRGLPEPRVLDIGTGSGAIALAIADEHLGARVTATDSSDEALAVARENVRRTGLAARVQLVRGDLFAGAVGPFDLVVSNPPYVSRDELDSLQPEIRDYEPREALIGEGVAVAIAERARDVLRSGGWLVLECANGQAGEVAAELRSLGYADVLPTPDLAGRDRVVEARRP
ncbi:MAG TPA: peptide chain release factor N(5)-glutamine methyltransferase [Gaiellaceae bacterium]|nr:peptide chain release factor N(5)-glutamine methyltransferase [Gaiellaceae bacterium]